jgi:eukaryotic-like serine/threonine-protein kinase
MPPRFPMPLPSAESSASLHDAATLDGLPDPPSNPAFETPTSTTGRVQLFPATTGRRPFSTQTGELRPLLQRRLVVVFGLGATIWGTIWIIGFTSFDPFFSARVLGPSGTYLAALTTLVWAAAAIGLRFGRQLTMQWLRGVEAVAIVVYCVSMLGFRYLLYRHGLSLPLTEPGGTNLFLCASALYNGFGWVGVIVGWGLVIPGMWRRTAAIVLLLAACPLVLDALMIASGAGEIAAFGYPLVITGQMLVTALVLALFGSYRLTEMEERVAAARQEVQAARMLGPYVLRKLIGSGGMGEVYLAEHHLLKRPCAIKLVRPERAGDPQVISRFRREVEATARLKHPNTVAVFDYGRTGDGTFYYVMEYLEGLGLGEIVQRYGALPPSRVVHVLKQICGALHEAHEAGLVHRDIKPSNILLCRHAGLYDVAKLVDFGLVRNVDPDVNESQQTRTDAIVGTPDYMSPEQADGDVLDARSDLYSLGATAFYLLTGRPPYSGKNALDILFAHRQEELPPLEEHIPGELRQVIERCLAKRREDRFASADELQQALDRCMTVPAWPMEDARSWWATVPVKSVRSGR